MQLIQRILEITGPLQVGRIFISHSRSGLDTELASVFTSTKRLKKGREIKDESVSGSINPRDI